MFESGIETMWKTLHQLAIPPRLYQICGWFIPWLAIASVVVLTVGWIWGFGFAPADYQQGNSYRIIYLHVPAAIWSMGIYASMAVAAFIGLVWQMKMANLAVAAMAPIGAVFTFIALVTGSAWGKPMWGTWWVWDARLTSELVLLFLYVGVIALWHAFDDRRLAGRAAGILVLIGVVNLPIIHYSVEWWNTLHQGSTRMQQSIDPAMRSPLRWSIFGFLLLSATLTLMRMRNLILLMEKRRPWVSELILKRGHENMLRLAKSPYVLKVFNYDENSDSYLMEKCDCNVYDYLENNPFKDDKLILQVIEELLLGMKDVHEAGIIHRDLHLGNILIKEGHVVLSDFGLSKDTMINHSLKSTSTPKNSHYFIDPIGLHDFTALDKLSDIYSIGKIIDYITGESELNKKLSFVISKATERNRTKRYAAVDELIQDVNSSVKEISEEEKIKNIEENLQRGEISKDVEEFVMRLMRQEQLSNYIVRKQLYTF